jgi:hypothetical protein
MPVEPVRRRWWREIKWTTWGVAMAVLVGAALVFVLISL